MATSSDSSSRSGKESLNRNAPGGLSFESAAWLVAAAGTAVGPWRLLRDARGFVWVWLVGHVALLAPVAGVILADYHLVRRRKLDLDGLYADAAPRGAEAGARGLQEEAPLRREGAAAVVRAQPVESGAHLAFAWRANGGDVTEYAEGTRRARGGYVAVAWRSAGGARLVR